MTLRKHVCNFCGRTEDEVTRMVAGPEADICDGCVVIAWEIVTEYAEAEATEDNDA